MTDLEIARSARLLPLEDVALKVGIRREAVEPFGRHKAKLDLSLIPANERPKGKLILVTAISPTLAGEGKTTTSVGLADALSLLGRKTILCLREPSLGPCFGMKGGATGGGYAQVVPMEEINLHFTGDFHAITAAHNLLAAMIDNHIYWGNSLQIDVRRIVWRRVMDMNDRALRSVVQSLGGAPNGFPRESGFDITVASEVMAILCLANDLEDLKERLSRIVVAYSRDREPVTARDIKADGAMAVLLKDAIRPNLAQTMEGNPVLIHGGPFGNIAHGCNSVIATRTALAQADYVVTEAGFGADLGAEKFFDIKCRQSGLAPDIAVLVATVRALKLNGGVDKAQLNEINVGAVRKGCVNLVRHIENLREFGVPVVVAINHFSSDSDAEIDVIRELSELHGSCAYLCRHWAEGGPGAVDLAQAVAALCDDGSAQFTMLYGDDLPLFEKINTIATRIYRAEEAVADPSIHKRLREWEEAGLGHLPICIAKTQYSFSTDPDLKGAPTGHVVNVKEVRLAAGAGFIVALCGEIMTMPGLPRHASAEQMCLNSQGQVEGLS